MQTLTPLALAFVLAGTATAQVTKHESLTAWTHAGGAPNWNDDVTNGNAEFGKVDELVSIQNLDYTSGAISLQPGWYAASCRLAKTTDQNGVAPIEFWTTVAGNKVTVTLPVADQKTDAFVHTPTLRFELKTAATLVFKLGNSGSTTKQNYAFDSFMLGQTMAGPFEHYEPMYRTWIKSYGGPYFNTKEKDSQSAFGFVAKLNYVWWMDWRSQSLTMQPGVYTANVRYMKVASMAGAYDIPFYADVGSGSSRVRFSTVAPTTDLVVDQYVLSPNLTFEVTAPNTPVRIHFRNISTGQRKANYSFDAFMIRSGAFETYGTACDSSLGTVEYEGELLGLGRTGTFQTDNTPVIGVLLFGGVKTNLDLTSVGAPNCTLLTTPVANIGAAATNGKAMFSLMVPNDPGLLYGDLFTQVATLDPQANALGVALSHGARVRVGK